MSISRSDLLTYLNEQSSPVNKKTIADAFSIKGDDRITLKNLLRDLEKDGAIIKQPGGKYTTPEGMPDVSVIEISETDKDGNVYAIIPDWDEDEQGKMPVIYVLPEKKPGTVLGPGDRALARLHRLSGRTYEAAVLRRLDVPQAQMMGIVIQGKHGYTLKPVSKKAKNDFDIPGKELNGAEDGDIVIAEIQPSREKQRRGGGRVRKKARVMEILGRQDDPMAISRISLYEEGLREKFTEPVLAETKNMTVPSPKGREDLREIPLVTIDGADARDFDDAVFAEKDDNGLYHIIVAIADVSYYVRPGSKLDIEAWTRGNSTYFPDRVVPMLPEALSNDLCSLRPDENRACVAVHMWIDDSGNLKKHKFVRGLMKSKARLTYEQVQTAYDGNPDKTTQGLLEDVITPLYEVFYILKEAREKRGALDIEMPERQILINEKGHMTGVKKRERLIAHMLIEEYMILANVAAAQALEKKEAPCVYRVHDRPDMDKLISAQDFLSTFGLQMKKGKISKPSQLNGILHHVEDHPCKELVHETVLRAQSAAMYSTENIGHFGLDLPKYAHFTSPIRRYSDLVVHRSLIKSYNLGPSAKNDGLSDEEIARLEETCNHISETERASMIAERNATDRFAASYLVQQEANQSFKGRIKSVTGFGLFVKLEETGVDGLVPIRSLGGDYYIHDEKLQALIGERTGVVFRLGAEVTVKVIEADAITGSAIFDIVNPEKGADIEGFELDVTPVKKLRRKSGGRKNSKGGKASGPPKGKKRSPHKARSSNKGKGRKSKR